jgi:hypothetical protein
VSPALAYRRGTPDLRYQGGRSGRFYQMLKGGGREPQSVHIEYPMLALGSQSIKKRAMVFSFVAEAPKS